ncbi:hypothetical protein Scep_014203 [Stephania cephalantha]|uniref:Uncharacterized protein n=1 Tax=Stephania cephalantha TaxID=152367 RepID=A0AAP0J2V1_9MAGN
MSLTISLGTLGLTTIFPDSLETGGFRHRGLSSTTKGKKRYLVLNHRRIICKPRVLSLGLACKSILKASIFATNHGDGLGCGKQRRRQGAANNSDGLGKRRKGQRVRASEAPISQDDGDDESTEAPIADDDK